MNSKLWLPIPGYLNSTYFDEIYHARTAYEHLHGMSAYEWTHPPLGKVTMMLGIQIFGHDALWLALYGRPGGCADGAADVSAGQAADQVHQAVLHCHVPDGTGSRHFTQTRIATIDSYSVFMDHAGCICLCSAIAR